MIINTININWTMLLFILMATVFGAVGALFLKIGSKQFRIFISRKFILEILKNYSLLFGVLLYGISTIFFILALRIGELSVVYPLTSITYIFITILSVYFLKEKMNQYKWLGILFIIVGVILVKL
jgi:uncharacterized membrane protein